MTMVEHQEQRFVRAVRAACDPVEKDQLGSCRYPDCHCREMPQAILAAINEWDRADGEIA